MNLWIVKITFTGQSKRHKKARPDARTIVIEASNMDLAYKRAAKYAHRVWPYWRFAIEQSYLDKVIS